MMPEDQNKDQPVTEEQAEEKNEKLKQSLEEEKKKAEGYLASWQRAQADFINYKRRTEQEREEFARFANAALILQLLPIVDDLERAFASVPEEIGDEGWFKGFTLIERKFRSILEAQGLTQIKSVGEPFDPNLHEAVRHDKGKDGIVIGELEKGYMLNGKLLRPAKVIVGSGEEID